MWCQNKHYFDHRFCCCRKCPYPSEFSQLFGFECTPNKRFEPLCSSVNTNCTGQTDRISTHFLVFPFLKGLPPKQPEGFGCFVCPNFAATLQIHSCARAAQRAAAALLNSRRFRCLCPCIRISLYPAYALFFRAFTAPFQGSSELPGVFSGRRRQRQLWQRSEFVAKARLVRKLRLEHGGRQREAVQA